MRTRYEDLPQMILPRTATLMTALVAILTISSRAAEPAPAEIVPPALKTFVAAELPKTVAVRNIDVRVTLTIADDGTVSEVVLKQGAGEPYDSAAIAAVRKMVFRPATRAGVAIPVTVPFTYRYRIPKRRGLMLPQRRQRATKEVAPGRVYLGAVAEMGTRTPLVGVTVIAQDSRTGRSWQAISDERGRFLLEALPPGELTVTVVTPDHQAKKRRKPILISGVPAPAAGRSLEVGPTIYLNPKAYAKFKTVVTEQRRKEAAAEITLSSDELTKVPGTFGDPTRVVATLPGVARSAFGLGYYVVRGASTENTGFLIDGHPAGYLYHLGGGPSVIHPALVERIRFYPAGYPANYGRFAGGLISVEQRENPDDRWHLDLEVDLTKATALFSIPFDDNKGMITLSFRRSYFDLLLELAALVDDSLDGIIFAYTDYQARIRYDITPELRWSFYVFGAEDELGLADTAALGIGFHRVRTEFAYTPSKTLSWKTSAAFEWFHTNAAEVAEDTDAFSIGLERWFVQLRSTLQLKPTKFMRLDVGIDALYADLDADLRITIPNVLGEVPGAESDIPFDSFTLGDDLTSIAPFVFVDWEPVKGFRLLPSVRLNIEYWGGDAEVTVDPKLATRVKVHDAVTLKAMAAIAHQAPNPVVTAEPFGDPTLPPVTAYQASLGVEVEPAEGWEISIEGFYNHFQDLLQGNQSDNALEETLFAADLSGRSYGLEVLIRKRFGDWVYGWLSYTLSRAERKAGPDEPWLLFGQDQTHVLNLAWTFILPDEWSIGARFQLTSGNPYNPVVDAKVDADAGRYRARTAVAQSRLPIFHRLDLRIDKRIRYDTYFIEIFLDIQNVYNAMNPETLQYSFDYKTVREGQGLPIIPTLGVRVAF